MVVLILRYFTLCLVSLGLAGLVGCTKSQQGSTVRIQFPPAPPELNQSEKSSLSALSGFAWSKVCFAVNVTATDLKPLTPKTCDIPVGVFSGMVAPGGETSLEVPRGTARKLEVFAYLRSAQTDPCPALKDSFAQLDRARIFRVGSVATFDVDQAVVDVSVTVSPPASLNDNLISQYQLPNLCRVAVTPVPAQPGSSRVAMGSAQQSGGRFTVLGTVSDKKSEAVMSGGKFQIQFSRKLD